MKPDKESMMVKAYIITRTGTALIVPEPMPAGVDLNDEAQAIKAKANHQRVFDLKNDSAIGLDKETAEKKLRENKFYVSHNPPKTA